MFPAALVMAVLASTIGYLGLTIGAAAMFACGIGALLHAVRFAVAKISVRVDEWRFRRQHGMPGQKDIEWPSGPMSSCSYSSSQLISIY